MPLCLSAFAEHQSDVVVFFSFFRFFGTSRPFSSSPGWGPLSSSFAPPSASHNIHPSHLPLRQERYLLDRSCSPMSTSPNCRTQHRISAVKVQCTTSSSRPRTRPKALSDSTNITARARPLTQVNNLTIAYWSTGGSS